MIHNRNVSNVCSLILAGRERQAHEAMTATMGLRTQRILRLQMDASDEHEPIRKHRGYSVSTNSVGITSVSAEKSNYL